MRGARRVLKQQGGWLQCHDVPLGKTGNDCCEHHDKGQGLIQVWADEQVGGGEPQE